MRSQTIMRRRIGGIRLPRLPVLGFFSEQSGVRCRGDAASRNPYPSDSKAFYRHPDWGPLANSRMGGAFCWRRKTFH
ncbi:hypothetical protein [Azospirillum argentinense]